MDQDFAKREPTLTELGSLVRTTTTAMIITPGYGRDTGGWFSDSHGDFPAIAGA